MEQQPLILDPCCGSRMMWFDRQHPDVVFGDRRTETLTVTDNSRGNASGLRTIRIEPDTTLDFRALPYPDETFRLVAFDPPHLVQAGPRSWLAAKYGKLSENWRGDIRQGFAECFRVLASDGVLVFKWNETQVKLREVLALTPHAPLFGNTSGKKAGTHWLVFMKPNAGGNATERSEGPLHRGVRRLVDKEMNMGIAYELKQDDLAACPFCGSINQDTSSNGMESHFVVCQDCGAEGPAKDTEQEAITAWFARATLPSNALANASARAGD